jgi:hypothetical protein
VLELLAPMTRSAMLLLNPSEIFFERWTHANHIIWFAPKNAVFIIARDWRLREIRIFEDFRAFSRLLDVEAKISVRLCSHYEQEVSSRELIPS